METSAAMSHPRWQSPRLARLGRRVLEQMGWTIENPFPSVSRSVVIVAPHSSNWDFIVGLSTAWAVDLKPTFVGKHTLFRWPLGYLMRKLGGIPVNREKTAGFVEKTSGLVADSDRIALVITPEGTRKAVERWRTGFYHIARTADVPIVPAYLDWGKRRVGFGAPFIPTGDVESDVETLQAFYSAFQGRRH